MIQSKLRRRHTWPVELYDIDSTSALIGREHHKSKPEGSSAPRENNKNVTLALCTCDKNSNEKRKEPHRKDKDSKTKTSGSILILQCILIILREIRLFPMTKILRL